jgi:hypothetical protein
MRAEKGRQENFETEGWSVHLASYSICGQHVAEVEAIASGVTIARARERTREEAEGRALEKALTRWCSTQRTNFDLMVGG